MKENELLWVYPPADWNTQWEIVAALARQDQMYVDWSTRYGDALCWMCRERTTTIKLDHFGGATCSICRDVIAIAFKRCVLQDAVHYLLGVDIHGDPCRMALALADRIMLAWPKAFPDDFPDTPFSD